MKVASADVAVSLDDHTIIESALHHANLKTTRLDQHERAYHGELLRAELPDLGIAE